MWWERKETWILKSPRNTTGEVEMVERVTVSSNSSRGMREQVSTRTGAGVQSTAAEIQTNGCFLGKRERNGLEVPRTGVEDLSHLLADGL